mgnify:CR=1 FL=1
MTRCPFCNEPPRSDQVRFDGQWWRVRCGNCGAMGPAERNPNAAAVAWGQRETVRE